MALPRFSGLLIAGAVAISGAGAALAQAPIVSPVTGQPQTLQVPNATKGHLDAATELVAVTGLASSFMQVIPSLMGQINTNITQTRPDLIPDMKKTLDELSPEFGKLPQDMYTAAARIYTAVMTEQECKDAVAFFKSPVGKKFIDQQPTVIGNMTPLIRNWTQQMSVKMMDRVREEMKKKGHTL